MFQRGKGPSPARAGPLSRQARLSDHEAHPCGHSLPLLPIPSTQPLPETLKHSWRSVPRGWHERCWRPGPLLFLRGHLYAPYLGPSPPPHTQANPPVFWQESSTNPLGGQQEPSRLTEDHQRQPSSRVLSQEPAKQIPPHTCPGLMGREVRQGSDTACVPRMKQQAPNHCRQLEGGTKTGREKVQGQGMEESGERIWVQHLTRQTGATPRGCHCSSFLANCHLLPSAALGSEAHRDRAGGERRQEALRRKGTVAAAGTLINRAAVHRMICARPLQPRG